MVWGTGNLGRLAIRAVLAHPELKLAGVVVRDAGKAGQDAGTLAGLDYATGVTATTDADALLGTRPAAVVYAASVTSGPATRWPTCCGRSGPAPSS